MTQEQAFKIYEIAEKEYRISSKKVYILIDELPCALVPVSYDIYVFGNNKSVKLTDYDINSVKFMNSALIPANQLIKLNRKDDNVIERTINQISKEE